MKENIVNGIKVNEIEKLLAPFSTDDVLYSKQNKEFRIKSEDFKSDKIFQIIHKDKKVSIIGIKNPNTRNTAYFFKKNNLNDLYDEENKIYIPTESTLNKISALSNHRVVVS